jgi:hypothetical protein
VTATGLLATRRDEDRPEMGEKDKANVR